MDLVPKDISDRPTWITRTWPADPTASGGRTARQAFTYRAYVPGLLANLAPLLPSNLALEVAEVERKLAQCQSTSNFLGLEALSRQLLRAESVSSSRIEGLSLSQRRLAQGMLDPAAADATTRAVLGNIRAMELAIEIGARPGPLQVEDLRRLHLVLLEGTTADQHAGQLRHCQNWIVGSSANPRHAEFIPPPEDMVPELLADLCRFLEREDLPTTLQAALAHAQFETIHPFADGNGRVGRTLIHVVLRRRNLAPRLLPPVSAVLATNAGRYIEGLTRYREGDVFGWCALFLRTLDAAITQSELLADHLRELQDGWRHACGRPRRDSATEKILQLLPGRPMLDGKTATMLAGVSDEAARLALLALEHAGVLRPVVLGKKRNRVWEAPEIIALLDNFEWELATPTRPEQPRRPSPHART